jgi:superfamily II DNA or RNA helicase
MPLASADIRPGLVVRHVHQPSKVGMLTGQSMVTVVPMAEVKWANQTQFEAVAALELFDVEEDTSFESLVRNRRYERIEALRSLMTFEKLSGSLSNVMYSMRTAEIQFFAHQFVPVLKFVNSPLSRLLIADEVGLGKTIEAGLIWTECRARYQARRLLVVCPPTLVPKWIRELQERFSIDAEFADAKSLRDRFDRFKQKGPSQSFALVTSYHALRPRKAEKRRLQPWMSVHGSDVRFEGSDNIGTWPPRPAFFRSLMEWEGVPFVDLVVFDEAHLMKNTATANHLVGDILSTSAQSVLALSATPLTTKTRDLYALMKLVDPDMFRSESQFNDLCRRNRAAVNLASQLSQTSIRIDRCLELLKEIPESAAQFNLHKHLNGITNASELTEDDRIKLLGKAVRLNELGSFMTRTRKVEITEHKATREAVTLDVEPTEQELIFYNSVLRLIRQRVAERGDALSLFHLIGPSLAMTSCLPVMAEKLRSGRTRWGDMEDLIDLEDAYGEAESGADFVGEDQSTILADREWLPQYDFEATDTKYIKLRNELLARSEDEKVIIFAFFKDTLAYLKRRLESDGLTCLLVTGDVTDVVERDRLLSEFQKPGYRVLLCSEVAAEGVDLQFCRVMVNYDLPWNPMRVEQRIGRIDRIGQLAKTIVIINFCVRGTIDGSIYFHLYQKIGVFNDTIGDLEGILGEHVNQLTHDLLTDELSPALAEEKIKLVAQAIARERALVAEIDEEAETLLGLRTYLQSNVRQGRSLGRYIKPTELRLFAIAYFQDTYTGTDSCQLNWDTPAEGCLRVTLSFRAMSDFESYLNRQDIPRPKEFSRETPIALLTFDPDVHESLKRKHRSLILANHLHPFVKWITSTYEHLRRSWHPASALRLATNEVPPGTYFYLVMRFSLKHPALSREELLFRVRNVGSSSTISLKESEALVNHAIDDGCSWVDSGGFEDWTTDFDAVWKELIQDCTELHTAFMEELELRLNSKRSQLESHFERRIESARRRLDSMYQSTQDRDQGIRVTKSQIKHLEDRLHEERAKLDSTTEAAPDFKRIACGLIKISALP